MAHRFRLLRLFSIDISVDGSWFLCAALIAWTLAVTLFPDLTPDLPAPVYWWMAAAGTIGLFASIVLHELAHALIAREFAVPVHAITLFVFGGVAEMEEEPRTAKSEFFIAAAGPAASLMLAGLFFFAEVGAVAADAPDALSGVLWYLALANAILLLFNLIPAFPLDGGRVFRAALWAWRGDLMWATSIAAAGGRLFGAFFMALGLLDIVTGEVTQGIWNLLIGLFLRNAAAAGRQEVVMHILLAGTPVSAAMNRAPISVPPDLSVQSLVDDVLYRYPHRSFAVADQGVLMGLIEISRIARMDSAQRCSARVRDVMAPPAEMEIVPPDADLLPALRRMRRDRRDKLWVADRGGLVGVLTPGDVQHYLAALAALRGRSAKMGFSALP